jgi:hypothetical protein
LESGDRVASHRFLRDWVSRHDPAGPIDGHIHWHLSLGELESDQPTAALERYWRAVAPGMSHCAAGLVVADAGGLFCRMLLDGVPLDGVSREPIHAFVSKLKGALGIPFVAAHAAALFAAFGERRKLDGLVETMGRSDDGGPSNAAYLVASAFRAYLAGDMRACVAALEQGRAQRWEAIGGSNEERALLGTLYARASARLTDVSNESRSRS